MKTMKRLTDRVLVIFKFEEQLYRDAGVPVEWVGHPLLDVMPTPEPREQFLTSIGLDPSKPIVALLPGSRRNELHAILPGLVDAAQRIRARKPGVQFVLARAPHLPDESFAPLAELDNGSSSDHVAVVRDRTDAVLSRQLTWRSSRQGPSPVQAALHECPMIVVYRLSPLTYRLGRPFVRLDTFAMANLVAGRRVVPELMQDDFTPEAVAVQAMTILDDPVARDRMRAELREVRAQLGPPGASARAAQAVIDVVRHRRPAGRS